MSEPKQHEDACRHGTFRLACDVCRHEVKDEERNRAVALRDQKIFEEARERKLAQFGARVLELLTMPKIAYSKERNRYEGRTIDSVERAARDLDLLPEGGAS